MKITFMSGDIADVVKEHPNNIICFSIVSGNIEKLGTFRPASAKNDDDNDGRKFDTNVIYGRTSPNDKILIPACRTGVAKMLQSLNTSKSGKDVDILAINELCFLSQKEMLNVICTIREFAEKYESSNFEYSLIIWNNCGIL